MPAKTASRRKPPPQDGGILASLSSNTASKRTPPLKTLIISKPCDAASSEDQEDVSVLESPRHNEASDESSSELEESSEETDDEPSTEDEEDDDSSSKEASSDSSISLCSMEEEDLEADQDLSHDDEIISENNNEEIVSDHDGQSDFDPESDFDPDDTMSDDEELEADEESIDSKPLRKKETYFAGKVSDGKELGAGEASKESQPVRKNETSLDDTLSDGEELESEEASKQSKSVRKKETSVVECAHGHGQVSTTKALLIACRDENEDSESDDEAISVIAEILEDSDTEEIHNESDRKEVTFDTSVVEGRVSMDAESAHNNFIVEMEVLDEEKSNGQSTSCHDQGLVVLGEPSKAEADAASDSQDWAEGDILHQTVKSSSTALGSEVISSVDKSAAKHIDREISAPKTNSEHSCASTGLMNRTAMPSSSNLNSEVPSSLDKSAVEHKDREITFCSGRASKLNTSHSYESTGLMNYDLSISPIKSGFTPERFSQANNLAENRTEGQPNPNASASLNCPHFQSTNPDLFSQILARSTRRENNHKSECTSNRLSMYTPPGKPVNDDDPMIELSINRAIRSLLKQEKASKRTNIRRGEWVLGSKLGSGAFGVVHVGMNTSTGSLMAVKSIRIENVAMEDVRREIELLKSLDHPNIVIYHGAEMDTKYLHIFQEWVPGGSLCSMLSKFGAFRRPVLRNYLSQILGGLAYLHDQRVMHRDLKGSNVLVNDAGVVKLADFGSSKRFEGCERSMMLSLTMRGTPYFMAPEVFEEKYSFKADIWSVGCVAFQMATASPPWKEMGFTNPVSLFNHVKATDCVPTSKVEFEKTLNCGKGGASLTCLLDKCFQRDPAKRPNASDLLCDPFFEHSSFADDNEIQRKTLFNISPSNEGVAQKKLITRMSPFADKTVRRNILSSINSPLLSPPIPSSGTLMKSPLPRSPQPNPKNWPAWAQTKNQEGSSDNLSDNTCTVDSLVYSSGKTGDHSTNELSLMGLKYLSIS